MAEKKTTEKEPAKDKSERVQTISANRDEQVGFHKGAISTLLKEREEMVKVVGIVDTLLKAHIETLQKLGVQISPQQAEAPKKKA